MIITRIWLGVMNKNSFNFEFYVSQGGGHVFLFRNVNFKLHPLTAILIENYTVVKRLME